MMCPVSYALPAAFVSCGGGDGAVVNVANISILKPLNVDIDADVATAVARYMTCQKKKAKKNIEK